MKLKLHKAVKYGRNGEMWPWCWILRGVLYANRTYKITNTDEKVECKTCLKHMGKLKR